MEIDRRIQNLHALESDLFDKGYRIAERINGNSDFRKDIRYTTYNTLDLLRN